METLPNKLAVARISLRCTPVRANASGSSFDTTLSSNWWSSCSTCVIYLAPWPDATASSWATAAARLALSRLHQSS